MRTSAADDVNRLSRGEDTNDNGRPCMRPAAATDDDDEREEDEDVDGRVVACLEIRYDVVRPVQPSVMSRDCRRVGRQVGYA